MCALIRTEVETSHQNVLFISAQLKVIYQEISIMEINVLGTLSSTLWPKPYMLNG